VNALTHPSMTILYRTIVTARANDLSLTKPATH
jgi:hypothetical protein